MPARQARRLPKVSPPAGENFIPVESPMPE